MGCTHLGDLPPTKVGKALEGQSQDVGCSMDGEALAGWNLLLTPTGENGKPLVCSAVLCPAPLVTGGPHQWHMKPKSTCAKLKKTGDSKD